jgi:hypothetical protein
MSFDTALTLTAMPLSATEGQPFSGTVATLSYPNSLAATGDFTVTIGWGDGQTSTRKITLSDSTYTVTGTHTYERLGRYTFTVRVENEFGTRATASAMATVTDAALTVTGQSVSATEGQVSEKVVATFTDANPFGLMDEYVAKIDWGNDYITDGTILANENLADEEHPTYEVLGPSPSPSRPRSRALNGLRHNDRDRRQRVPRSNRR